MGYWHKETNDAAESSRRVEQSKSPQSWRMTTLLTYYLLSILCKMAAILSILWIFYLGGCYIQSFK